MKCNKICRILGIATILSLLMVAIPMSPALAYDRDISLSSSSGRIGDEITITGEDFAPSTETTERWARIYFAKDEAAETDWIDDDVNTYQLVEREVIGFEDDPDEGEFEATFEVPAELTDGSDDEDVEPGTYYIYVTTFTGTSESYIRAVEEFTVFGGEIEIDPDEGPVGTEVEISGTEFGDREDIFIEYDGDEIDIESGDDATDSDGEFKDTIIIIPESIAGDHTITVFGEDTGAEVEATFTVEPEITVSPTSGTPEAEVTVSGTGFDERSDIVVELDGDEVATETTDRDGSFEVTFDVPALASGTYDLEVWDEDDNSVTIEFSIMATTSSLNLATGHVGTELTITGAGYTAGETITIKYDATNVATATVKTDGTFSATFKVPVSQYGDHDITVSDGTTTEEFTFTMESEAPSTPQPLLPEMGVEAEQPVHFDWKDVDDASGVTYTLQIATRKDFAANSIVLEKTGLAESAYTITQAEKLAPVSEEEPYYWRIKAVDGASNESEWTGAGSFYTGLALGMMPDWVMYALFGVGGLFLFLIGIWVGRRTAYYSY